MDTADVSFQTAELGKVDEGGGGTIAYILANYDKAAFMTARRLGVIAHVSESTVVRFAVHLGYEAFRGYIAFLKEA